ncbi:MAG: ribosomal RNA small subunit methyltransferase A [Treponema sp.]|nr:ribosomal RNA small subunit methyltransferase A [Treponema sp.]
MKNIPDYNSPAELNAFLEQRGMAMQKKFGQNFLLNEGARKKIALSLGIQKGESVWEVGPGLGSMTKELLDLGAKVTVFEIDRGFSACLEDFFEDEKNAGSFNLVQGDVLKTWKPFLEKNGSPKYFFGNLPYNIAAALIADTIEAGVRFEKCAFTVQKEVALRMAAQEASQDYSSFSVLCQWAYDVKTICDLGRANFWPRPNVESRAVLFTKKAVFPGCQNERLFVKMQRALFSSRRKTVKNNLTKFLSGYDPSLNLTADKVLEKAAIDPSARAEALNVKEMLRLSDAINFFIM